VREKERETDRKGEKETWGRGAIERVGVCSVFLRGVLVNTEHDVDDIESSAEATGICNIVPRGTCSARSAGGMCERRREADRKREKERDIDIDRETDRHEERQRETRSIDLGLGT
jgi:hypothetical protein